MMMIMIMIMMMMIAMMLTIVVLILFLLYFSCPLTVQEHGAAGCVGGHCPGLCLRQDMSVLFGHRSSEVIPLARPPAASHLRGFLHYIKPVAWWVGWLSSLPFLWHPYPFLLHLTPPPPPLTPTHTLYLSSFICPILSYAIP